jgi:hypothetical protein
MLPFNDAARQAFLAFFTKPAISEPLSAELAQIPEIYRECLAIEAFFITLGVEPDDLSLGVTARNPEDGEGSDLIMVAKLEPRSMVIRVAPLVNDFDFEVIRAGWTKATEIWNRASREDKNRLVVQSDSFEDFPTFLEAAADSNIVFPAMIDYLVKLRSLQYRGARN